MQKCRAAVGHFDELRGPARGPGDDPTAGALRLPGASLSPAWSRFVDNVADQGAQDLDRRAASLARQIRDNGVTYNVYADENGPQRPWSLDLFPLIIDPDDWTKIEIGVSQRMRLLERVMADVYGEQQLVAQGLLPAALVQGHPGYLRSLHGVRPVGGTHLHIAAFDLARGPDGNWWVAAQRCQAPSGLGYLLENRLAVSSQFPQAFQALRVQRLASTYRALMDAMKRASPMGQDSHLALLTPGPFNETYFEHAYLARYLGLSLVEGSDLTVRDEHLYLKTLKGLVPVHGLLKRVDDQYLDPLELRSDSSLGVPGLLQVIRAGHLLVANAPGSAFLESPALLAFMPAMAHALLGEDLQLPALPTWWCGERSAMEEALAQLGGCSIKATYSQTPLDGNTEATLGRALSRRELDEWTGRIVRQSEEHTVQMHLPLSQMPTWQSHESAGPDPGCVLPRSVMLRVFAVADGVQSWRVLPGGLARLAAGADDMASMQRGGSSADVWALTHGDVDATPLLQPHLSPAAITQRRRVVTSRAAENLFWLGRYTERTENAIRLARLSLECLNGEEQSTPTLLAWLGRMGVRNGLVPSSAPSAIQARRVFERTLIANLASASSASVGYNLRALKASASTLRERLSQEHWQVILRAEQELSLGCAAHARSEDFSALGALRVLSACSDSLAAITGAQTDRMTRDDGWRLLSIGRHIERLGFLAASLQGGFETGSVHRGGGFEAMLALFDSSITFRAQYQQSQDLAALTELLVLDPDNPRSLSWVAHTLRGRLAKLAGCERDQLSALSHRVPELSCWRLEQLCDDCAQAATADRFPTLTAVLTQCVSAAHAVSDQISTTYFTHSIISSQSVGTR